MAIGITRTDCVADGLRRKAERARAMRTNRGGF